MPSKTGRARSYLASPVRPTGREAKSGTTCGPRGQSGLTVPHWTGRLPCGHPPIAPPYRWTGEQDASPHTQRPGSSLRWRDQPRASRRCGVLRVGARAGPARAAAPAVPGVLAGKGRSGPKGVRRAQPGRVAGTGLTRLPAGCHRQRPVAAGVRHWHALPTATSRSSGVSIRVVNVIPVSVPVGSDIVLSANPA
jgi:hypothetical protein